MNEYIKGMAVHLTVSLESVLRDGFMLNLRIANGWAPVGSCK